LREYAAHAWRLARNVWLLALVLCIVLGAALPPHNPAKMFDEHRPFTIYTVVLLAVCGIVCAQCARLAEAGGRALWTLLAVGFVFLAVDDLVQIHERLDRIINQVLGLNPKAKWPDLLDAGIIVLYGLIGLGVLYRHRRAFLQLRGFVRGIGLAGVAATVMVILDAVADLVHEPYSAVILAILEDACEALSVSLFFWTFVTARFQLRRSAARATAVPVAVAGTVRPEAVAPVGHLKVTRD
jgi:hypothetical protein